MGPLASLTFALALAFVLMFALSPSFAHLVYRLFIRLAVYAEAHSLSLTEYYRSFESCVRNRIGGR